MRTCRCCGVELPSMDWVLDEIADAYHHAAADADKRPPQTFRDTAIVASLRARLDRLCAIGRGSCGDCFDAERTRLRIVKG